MISKGQTLKDSTGRDRNAKSMMRLLPDDLNTLNTFLKSVRGPYLRIAEKTGIARQTIVDGLNEGGLFSLPTLFKIKDFIRSLGEGQSVRKDIA